MSKTVLLVSAVLLFAGIATAATKQPSHPLSQVKPVNVDFNMSDQAIFNISELRLRDGIQIDGTRIQDPGNVDVLVWDSASNEWDVKNADLNLTGNALIGVGSTQCGPGEVLLGDGSCTAASGDNQNLSDVLSQGNSAGKFNIDMNTQNIIGVNEISNGSEQVGFGSGIDMKGNNIINPGNTDGVDLDNPGEGLTISGNQYAIESNSIGNTELNNSERLTIDGIELTSSMNVSGNTIHYVGPPQHQYDAVNKSYVDASDDTISDDQNLQEVLSQGNSAGSFNIDMNQQDLLNVRRLKFADRNSDGTRYNITESGGDLQLLKDGKQRLNVLKGGGIEVKNGHLDLGTSTDLVARKTDFAIQMQGGRFRLYDPANTNDALDVQSDGPTVFSNTVNGVAMLRMNASGGSNVEIPNGNLDVGSNSVQDVANIYQDDSSTNFFGGCSSGNYVESIASDGTITCATDSTGADITEPLNETLEAGNLANQSINMAGSRIIELADPTDAQDAATKSYVDNNDDTGTDDQTLSVNNDSSGTHDTITIENGNQVTVDDDFAADDQDLASVLSQGNSAGTSDIDMNNSNIGSVTNISFKSGAKLDSDSTVGSTENDLTVTAPDWLYLKGGYAARIYSSGVLGLEVNQNQNVQVPNGNLDVSNDLTIQTGGAGQGKIKSQATNTAFFFEANGLNSNTDTVAEFEDQNGDDVMRLEASGEVNVPAGSLSLSNNTLKAVGPATKPWHGVNKSYVDSSDDTVSDDQNLNEVLVQGNGTGGVDIDLEGAELVDSTGKVTLGGGDVEIPNGNLNVSGGDQFRLGTDSDNVVDITAKADRVSAGDDDFRLSVEEDGTEVSRIATTAVTNSEANMSFFTNGGSLTRAMGIDTSQNVNIPNGNLNVEGSGRFNSLVGDSSGSQCGSNEFLNGNGNCVTDTDTDTDNQTLKDVLSQGNSAGSFNIDMNGQQVINASKVGVGTTSPSQDLDVDGTASVSNSGTTMEVDSSGDVVVTLGSG